MPTPSLLATVSDDLWTALPDRHPASDAIRPDPASVLTLIAQAGLRMRDLQQWQDHVHADAGRLLARVRHERAARTAELEALKHEVSLLRERSTEAESAARLAFADREDALILQARADARAVAAERRAAEAEARACRAEDWLSKLQDVMADEFVGEPQVVLRSDHARP